MADTHCHKERLRAVRERVAAIDPYTAQGATGSGLIFADVSTEHVRAFQAHVLDIIDEALSDETKVQL